MSAREPVVRVGDLAWPDVEPGKLYVERELIRDFDRYGTSVEVLRVISVHQGGQIRGYQRKPGAGAWGIWLPCYTGDWPEMDAAVAALVNEPVIGLSGGRHEPRRGEQLTLGGLS